MIRTDDLILWAREHAVGHSIAYVNGWVRGDDLRLLAAAVTDREPFDYLLPHEAEDIQLK